VTCAIDLYRLLQLIGEIPLDTECMKVAVRKFGLWPTEPIAR
jgi:hypothetical protein